MRIKNIVHFVLSVKGINRPLRNPKPISVSDMSLDDVTSSLLVGNEELFSVPASTDPVTAMSESDRTVRQRDVPDMVNVGRPADDFFTNLWKWVKDVAGLGPVPFVPYPLYTVDYLNGAVYKRISDPSDSQDPSLAGDIIIENSWSNLSVPSWNVWPQPGNIKYVFESLGSINQTCARVAFHESLERIKESSGNCFSFSEIASSSNATVEEEVNPLRVIIDSSPRCFASLGYNSVKGSNIINVGAGCANLGTIMHLLGHVLGMAHEEQRPDAADYISVVNANIDVYGMSPASSVDPTTTPKFQYVFTPLNGTGSAWEREIQRFPYEYGSLMHNSMFRYSFSLGNNATLKATHLGVDYADLLGNRGYFTTR
jgi:hypothetical protein